MRAIGIWAAVVGLAFAGAAHAQQQCFPNNPSIPAAGTTCYPTGAPPLPENPQPPPAPVAAGPVVDDSGSYPAVCAGNRLVQMVCAGRVSAERKEVGTLMANGQCDDAMKRALREADYKMAATVKQLCTK